MIKKAIQCCATKSIARNIKRGAVKGPAAFLLDAIAFAALILLRDDRAFLVTLLISFLVSLLIGVPPS